MNFVAFLKVVDSFIPPLQAEEIEKEKRIEDNVDGGVKMQQHLNRFRFLLFATLAISCIALNSLGSAFLYHGIHGLLTMEALSRSLFLVFAMRVALVLPTGHMSYQSLLSSLILYVNYRMATLAATRLELAWVMLPLHGLNSVSPTLFSRYFESVGAGYKLSHSALYFGTMLLSLWKGWGTTVSIHVSWSCLSLVVVNALTMIPSAYFIQMSENELLLVMQQLSKMVTLADVSSKAKTMFISNVSHDLRTPIQSMLGFINLLEESSLDSIQESYMSAMKSSCYHLTAIINNVLDFSKIEQDKMVLIEEDVDFFELAQKVIDSTAALAEGKTIDLLCDINIARTHRFARTDEKALSRVLTNLIANAVKFTQRGYVKLTMTSDQKLTGKTLTSRFGLEPKRLNQAVIQNLSVYTFQVQDTGRGMTKEFIDGSLFNPFSQENTYLNPKGEEGTGLGLSLSQKIVSAMGGRICAESEYGKGSCFTFSVKLAPCLKESDSERNLHLITKLLNIEIHSYVYFFGTQNDNIMRVIEQEVTFWNDKFKKPRILSSFSNLTSEANIVFLIDMSFEDDKDIAPDVLRDLSSAKLRNVCFVTISRARRSALAKQLEILKVLEDGTKTKVASVLSPVTPLKLHRAVATCISHISSYRGEQCHLPKKRSIVDLTSTNLLIAEDNTLVATVLSKLLKKKNIQHSIAYNGEEAFKLWKENPGIYDIILMDIQMPVMNGFAAVEKIRQVEGMLGVTNPIKILFMSANASIEEMARAKTVGGNDYLTKPVDLDTLLSKIKDLMRPST
jgi:signal transduction histidine kinase/CheY-like chemotaxis protein